MAVVEVFQDGLKETAALCEQTKRETGPMATITTFCCDVGDEALNQRLVEHINSHYKHVDFSRQNKVIFTPGKPLDKLAEASNSIS